MIIQDDIFKEIINKKIKSNTKKRKEIDNPCLYKVKINEEKTIDEPGSGWKNINNEGNIINKIDMYNNIFLFFWTFSWLKI